MSRKQHKRTAGSKVFNAIAGIFIFAIVFGVGLSVASADSSDDLVQAGAFGFDEATQAATAATQESIASDAPAPEAVDERATLATRSVRTIDASMDLLAQKEQIAKEREAAERKAERERARAELEAQRQREAAENAAVIERVKAQKRMQGIEQETLPYQEPATVEAQAEPDSADEVVAEQDGADAAEPASAPEPAPEQVVYEYDLPAVDWTVGREAFISEWTARIDAYLAGFPLEGYGYVFAEAAWDNGVDPRWSPAISNTESTRGTVCFLPCNAWGWGSSSWDDWESAIRAHVAGLAEVYGYCITPEAAAIYCPPNAVNWYYDTIGQMACI